MLIQLGGFQVEAMSAGLFIRCGSREFWLERTGYRPAGRVEIARSAHAVEVWSCPVSVDG